MPNASPAVAPGPPGDLLLKNLRAMRKDPLRFFLDLHEAYGDVVRVKVANRLLFLCRNPEHVKVVLQDRQTHFSKQTRGYQKLRRILGNGLVTSEGDFWLRQRRIAQPGFHRQKVARFAGVMVEHTGQMLEAWDRKLASGAAELDVAEEMMRLTLRIVGQTLLSTDVSAASDVVGKSITALLKQILPRTTALFELPTFLPTRMNREFWAARAGLDGVVFGIIGQRRKDAGAADDLLSMLMAATDAETGETMSDAQLRDEVMTLFLAGHETTANALSWTFLLLSQHPEVAARLGAEVDAVLGGRPPRFEDLPALKYTAMVIQESMRLYPPIWILMRRAEQDEELGGYAIPKGAFVATPPYVLHRNPAQFENPEAFDPERFAPERAGQMHRFAYIPFSAGPRICIGNSFAMMEAQLIVAAVVQRFTHELVAKEPPAAEPTVTLRPKGGLMMRLKRRG